MGGPFEGIKPFIQSIPDSWCVISRGLKSRVAVTDAMPRIAGRIRPHPTVKLSLDTASHKIFLAVYSFRQWSEANMANAYWVITFKSISDQAGVDRYAAAAGPAIRTLGGRVLAAGMPAFVYEAGDAQRVAIVEFSSLAAADAAYRSPDYQTAVTHLVGAAEREVRIVEGR